MEKTEALTHLAKVIRTVSPQPAGRRVVFFDFRCREWMSQTWGTFAVDWGSYLRNRVGNLFQGASTSNHALIRVCTSYAEYLRERQAEWHLFGSDAPTIAPTEASFYISARHLADGLTSDRAVADFLHCLEAEATCGALTLDGPTIVADRSFAYGGGLCPEQGAVAESVTPLFHGFDTLDLLSLYSESPSVSLAVEPMTPTDIRRKLSELGKEGRAESTRWLGEIAHDVELLTVRVSGVPSTRLDRLVSTFGASARAYYPSRDELERIKAARHLCLGGTQIPADLGARGKVVCWFDYAGQPELWSDTDRVQQRRSPGLVLGGFGRFRGSPNLFVGGSLLAAMKWEPPASAGASPTVGAPAFTLASILAMPTVRLASEAPSVATASGSDADRASLSPSASSGSYASFFDDSEARPSTFGTGPLRPSGHTARRRPLALGRVPFGVVPDDFAYGSGSGAGDVVETDETRVELGAGKRGGPGFHAASNGAILPRKSTGALTQKIATASAEIRSGRRARRKPADHAIYDVVLGIERVKTRTETVGVGDEASLAAAELSIETKLGASARIEGVIARNQVRVHVEAFAGVEVTATAQVRISGLTMVAETGVVVGVGGSGRFEASMMGGKLHFRGKLKASVGVGLSEDVTLEVDVERIAADLQQGAEAVAREIGERIPTLEEARAKVRELLGIESEADAPDEPIALPDEPIASPDADEGSSTIPVTFVPDAQRLSLSDDALQITIMLAELAGKSLMMWHAGASLREIGRAAVPLAAKHARTLSEPFVSAVAGQWADSANVAMTIGLRVFGEAIDGAGARELAQTAGIAALENVGPLVIATLLKKIGAASVASPALFLFNVALFARDAPRLLQAGRDRETLELAGTAVASVAAGLAAAQFGAMAAHALVGSRDMPKSEKAGAAVIAALALGAATYGTRMAVAYRTRLWDSRGHAAGQEASRQFLNDDSVEGRYWQMLLLRLGLPSGDVATLKAFGRLAHLISAAPSTFWSDRDEATQCDIPMNAMDVLILATYGRTVSKDDWSSRMTAFATSLDARHPSKSTLLNAASPRTDV